MMKDFIKKSFAIFMTFWLTFSPIFAKDNIKIIGDMNTDFTLYYEDLPEEISFTVAKTKTIPDLITIPEDSNVTVEVISAEAERRWHKCGLIIGKIKNYLPCGAETPVNVSNKNIYVIIRKYEPINGKDAAILSSEIILTQAAGIVGSCFIIFAPVDIVYFFTKGAITREKHSNRFIAGVRDAYDNSIFWFWLKGKKIELKENDIISVKDISQKKVEKLTSGIKKRDEMRIKKFNKKIEKLDEKTAKRQLKYDKKEVSCAITEFIFDNEL